MKKIFTLFLSGITYLSFAGTPTINGVYSPSEGWGTQVATGDNVAGWADANAKKLYVTYDANYVYFGAECTAQSWQQFILVVNTKPGGGRTDAWGRTIAYNHTNAPDFLFRGDIAGSNYSEFHIWNGTGWDGTGTNINAAGTEVKGVFDGANNGFLEVRVPRSVIGFGLVLDVQFIIGGNNGGVDFGHGCFDAIPNDNNGTSWSAPGNFTSVTNYVPNVPMPATLNYFNGTVKGNTAELKWQSNTEINFSHYIVEASNTNDVWNNIATINARGANQTYTTTTTINKNTAFRLKMVDKDGSFTYSNQVFLRAGSIKKAEIINSKNQIILSLTAEAGEVNTEIFSIDGKRISAHKNNHAGGTSTYYFNNEKLQNGIYIVKTSINGSTEVLKALVH